MATAQSARTHCPHGHEYTPENTYRSDGRRICRTCSLARSHARQMSLGLSRPTYVDDGELVLAHCVHDSQDECWPWTGAMQGQGYGQYGKPMRLAHRISYEFFVGPIPEGLTLDHLCRNRQCVNPSHLEPVTRGENVLRGESLPARNARKTHCPKGHPYDDINTYVSPNTGWRQCKACRPPRG